MADPNTRQGKRTPVTLKIKFKSETLEQFIERYAVDVSQGGIFIRTKEPLAVGTQMKFEFQLRDASPLIAGEGTVVWTRENDPSRPAIAPGMGVRFDRLADGSQAVLERILAEKAKQAPNRSAGNESPTKPPLFTDTPTRVAPAPVQEALGVRPRAKSDSEQTPLPPPRPFHSDADDFDEKAFEEATKVRSLEELAAQTAGLAGLSPADDPANDASDDAPTNTAIPMPSDELAARRKNERADSTLSEPPEASRGDAKAASADAARVPSEHDRESAPGLPEPPSRAGDSGPPANKAADAPRTKLGLEPAKAATRAKSDSAAPHAVPAEPSIPVAPQRSSAASIIIMLLVLVAGAAAAVWWFVLREDVAREVAQDQDQGSAGSAVATNPEGGGSAMGSDGSATGSDGSAAAMVQDGSGSATAMVQDGSGSAGSATVEPPPAAMVDTVITASLPKNASVEIAGTDQKGTAPFTAKLEKDKTYKAKVSAPGFMTKQIELKGGQARVTAKLAPKLRLINVTTDPPGAAIYIDGVDSERISPAEVLLNTSQSLRPRVRISLRRPGFRPVDQILDARKFQETDSRMTASVTAKLPAMQRPTGTDGGSSTHTGSGSATTPSGGGSGSATTPSGGESGTTPSGGGAGTAPSGGGTTAPSGGGGSTPSGGGATKSGSGSAAKAPTSSNVPTASSTATPSASTGEPEPTWAK